MPLSVAVSTVGLPEHTVVNDADADAVKPFKGSSV